MRRPILRVWLLAAFVYPLPGQSRQVIPTDPAHLDTLEGDSFLATPGRFSPSRAQFVYDSSVLPLGPLALNGFALRGDGGRVFAGGHIQSVRVLMSTPALSAARRASLAWDANHGPDATLVIARLNLGYPPLTGVSPEPFSIAFPLDRPFHWPGGALTLDILASGTSLIAHPYYLDAQLCSGLVPPPPSRREISGSAYPPGLTCHADPVLPGGLLLYRGTTTIPFRRIPVMVLLGACDRTAGPVRLPHDLSVYGARGAILYTEPVAILAGFSDPASPSGAFQFAPLTVPLDPSLVGTIFFDQALCFDPSLNPAGIGAGPLAKNTLGGLEFSGQYPAVTLYSHSPAAGYLWTGNEPVARFFAPKALIVRLNI